MVGGAMFIKDHPDSPSCFVSNRQLIYFVFSQPQSAKPGFLSELLEQRLPVPKEGDQFQNSIARDGQLHQVDISIRKEVLKQDVMRQKAIEVLRASQISDFSTTSFYLSPGRLNSLLNCAAQNLLDRGASAVCDQNGIAFTMNLKKGEILYMVVMSRTPASKEIADAYLGYIIF